MQNQTIEQLGSKMDDVYGLVKERSEGTVYLMRKSPEVPGWAEEVAVRVGGEWCNLQKDGMGGRYMVLWDDVEEFTKEEILGGIPEKELVDIFGDLD